MLGKILQIQAGKPLSSPKSLPLLAWSMTTRDSIKNYTREGGHIPPSLGALCAPGDILGSWLPGLFCVSNNPWNRWFSSIFQTLEWEPIRRHFLHNHWTGKGRACTQSMLGVHLASFPFAHSSFLGPGIAWGTMSAWGTACTYLSNFAYRIGLSLFSTALKTTFGVYFICHKLYPSIPSCSHQHSGRNSPSPQETFTLPLDQDPPLL